MIRVLIADDQTLFMENLKIMLEALTDDIRIIGMAINGIETVEMASSLRPDLILMDVRMPVMDGIKATREILRVNPNQKILIITSFQEESYAAKALKYGAMGYLLKNMQAQSLISAIRSANDGIVTLSNATAGQLFGTEETPEDDETLLRFKSIFVSLNQREKEILKLMIKGETNRAIATMLYLSEPTVRNYISTIYSKFGSSIRTEVVKDGKKILEYFEETE